MAQDDEKGSDVALFQGEDEIMEVLNNNVNDSSDDSTKKQPKFKMQDPLAVVWEREDGTSTWYIGFYLGKNLDGTNRVNHLTRHAKSNDVLKREKANVDDIQDVYDECRWCKHALG